jgi:hypothetical protein
VGRAGSRLLSAVTSQPRRIQHCPLCGLAMLGSRANENNPDFDTFACLKCGTTMSFTSPPKGPDDAKPDC